MQSLRRSKFPQSWIHSKKSKCTTVVLRRLDRLAWWVQQGCAGMHDIGWHAQIMRYSNWWCSPQSADSKCPTPTYLTTKLVRFHKQCDLLFGYLTMFVAPGHLQYHWFCHMHLLCNLQCKFRHHVWKLQCSVNLHTMFRDSDTVWVYTPCPKSPS